MRGIFGYLILLFGVIVHAEHSNPLKNPNICGRPTCKGTGKFNYGPDTQQVYEYFVNVQSLFNGTNTNDSNMAFKATAILKFLSECDGIVSFKDISLTEKGATHSNTAQFSNAISEFDLRFSFNDGVISEICPNEKEKIWVLNLKRGFLSTMHNSMKRFDLDHSLIEEDVRGKCQTNYKVMGTKETSLLIEKTKDLSSCESRSKLHSIVQSTPYNFRTNFQESESLLKSSSRCILSIDHRIYNEITCEESYMLQPFSNHDAGASTFVMHKLILVDEVHATFTENHPLIARRVPLLFDHIPSPRLTHDDVKTSTELIKKMCRLSADDVQIEFSDLFTKFIQTLRVLTPSAFTEVYEHSAKICPTGKKHMLDALPYVNTAAAIVVMKDVILKKGVPENTVNDWLFSMSFTPRPDEEIMNAVAELLKQTHYKPAISLSIGALTHTFCSQNSNCQKTKPVNDISAYLESKILSFYTNDTNDRETQDSLIVTLKALGNSGVASEGFQKELIRIIENETTDISIRIPAIECHRRLPCDKSRDYFENLYRNIDQKSELRIAAYLQVMRCPNYLLIRTIKHTLESEEVNQVGSFVWTHLTNLLKSSIPSRVEIQGLLSDTQLVKKFSSDVRKFSHNREGSVFFEEYNVGASYENNVIFSTSSYIPRSSMFNITVDLFGKSVNLLEMYGRMEGFENYLESIFGPKGPYSSKQLQDTIPGMRWARNAENNKLESQVRNVPNVMENKFGQPKVALGFKVFGNDLKYNSFQGYDEIKSVLEKFNPMYHLNKIFSGKEINYSNAGMFLDSTYVVPCGAGLPISVTAVGTSSINLKLFGSLNTANFAKTKELELKADIRPSVSLDVTGTMSVDAYFANTGLKLKTSMYTSSAIDGVIKIKGPKLVSVKFSLPQKTSEIFGVRSELFVLERNIEERQQGLKEHNLSESICTWPAVDKTVGLKLCADYHFMNVTKISNSPYFLLAGPAGFRLFLEKSDPTAKTYLFEYKWTDRKDSSLISLTFDVPGSSLGRILGANFTINRQTQNVTLLLQSSSGTMLARGKYKNTDDEKYLQVAVDVNNVKHFDTSISLVRKHIQNGYTYYPKLYLGVSGSRVVEIQGAVKFINKRGISQYDVDLKFQTKRITSKLLGYVSQTQASAATKFKLYYKFGNTREQGVDFGFSIDNRSRRNINNIRGLANLESTSYPYFNFDSTLNFLKANGHLECGLNVTSNHKSVEREQMKFGIFFSHKALPDSTRLVNALVFLNKPSKNINLKTDFKYKSKNPNTDVALIVHYGEKQVAISVYYSHLKTKLEDIELKLNVSIPSFTPMLVRLKVHERAASDFAVNFRGTWFSGHSLTAVGIYQDKSSIRTTNHHIKLLLRSPSFAEIITDCQYFRDNNELKFNLKLIHDNEDYSFLFKHLLVSPERATTEAKLKYKTKLYFLTASSYFGDHQRISLELHIDQLRDISFSAWGYNKEFYKAAGIELKWDANRDPNQKLVVSGNFTTQRSLNYEGNMLISYPGRTVLGNFDFLFIERHFNTLTRISWDNDQSFAVGLTADYLFDKHIYFILSSELVTPVENWKYTYLKGGFHHDDMNMYRVNGSVDWEGNQHVSVDLFGNYSSLETSLECEYRSVLSSTLSNIPSLSALVKHSQNKTRSDSNLKLMYDPEHIIDIKSNWQIDSDQKSQNLTGTVITQTPFAGFNEGYLIGKIHMKEKKYLRAFADLDLDHKKYLISVEGKLKKLTDSMLVVNITTPIEKYKEITAKLGFSEEKRYFVAHVLYPGTPTLPGNLGIEVLLDVHSLTHFDTRFSVGTPMEFLQRFLLVAKLKPETADFRAGWNTLLGGFTGVWHYSNVADFEYSLKIYTPIEQFEENSVIFKVVIQNRADIEMAAKFSVHKLGVKVLSEPKPALYKELGIKTDEVYGRKETGVTWSAQDEDDDSEDEEEDNPLCWSGLVEIDAIIYPTMKGKLDIEEKGPLYVFVGKLTLPDGDAELTDELEYHNLFAMKNKLHVTTPYDSYKIVTSNYNLEIMPGNKYLLALNLDYQNQTKWIKSEVFVNYLTQSNDLQEKIHNATLKLLTPFSSFPLLNVHTSLEIKKNIYRANLSVATNNTDVSLAGNVKIDKGVLDTEFYLHAKTLTISIPPIYLKYKRTTDYDDNTITVNLNVPELMNKEVFLQSKWLFKSYKHFHSHFELETPFSGLEKSIVGIKVILADVKSEAFFTLNMFPISVDANTTLADDILHSSTLMNINGKEIPIKLTCRVIKLTPTSRTLNGNLILKSKLYKITGQINYNQTLPVAGDITFAPEDGSNPLEIRYSLQTVENGFTFLGSVHHSQNYVKVNADTHITDVLNWDILMKAETSNPKFKLYTMKTVSNHVGNKTTLTIEATTPIPRLENPKFGASFERSMLDNHFKAYYNLEASKGSADVNWVWVYMENMNIRLLGYYEDKQYKSASKANAFYINPGKAFKFVQLGSDVQVDNFWGAGSNITLILPQNRNMSIEAHLKLPPPKEEVHTAKAKLFYLYPLTQAMYLVKYNTVVTKKNYGSEGKMKLSSTVAKTETDAYVNVEWQNSSVNNSISYDRGGDVYNLIYRLGLPSIKDRHYLISKLGYQPSGDYHNVTCEVFQPENKTLGFAKVNFRELSNMNGNLNVTIPYKDVNYAGVNFATETSGFVYNRYLKVFWPHNDAVLDGKCNIISGATLLERTRIGKVILEVPLATRHIAEVDYTYKEKPQLSTGDAVVGYNGDKVLSAAYNCLSESRAGSDKDTIHVELRNKLLPVGTDYVHEYKYGATRDGEKEPSVDIKQVHLFHLTNATKFDIRGDLKVETTLTGQKFDLSVIHANKTITLKNDYDILDQQFKQHSRLDLGPKVWIEYYLDVLNKTENEEFDSQQVRIDVKYPLRNFTAQGSYKIGESSISTDVYLEWDEDNKTVQAGLDWKKPTDKHEELQLTLKHPSFEKDVVILGEYEYGGSKIIDAKVKVDYANDPEQTFIIRGQIDDNSDSRQHNYSYQLQAEHERTRLHLNSRGDFSWTPNTYNTVHYTVYKRSWLPAQTAEALAKLNLLLNEIELKKENFGEISHLKGVYAGKFPIYSGNLTTTHEENDANGQFYLNLISKIIQLQYNMTTDGSQSLQMYGDIPDARSAEFSIWRDYDDIRVLDVTYYLKMNHSRLIMSSLKWRPELLHDVKTKIKDSLQNIYDYIQESISETRQYVRSEANDSLNGIWQDAKPLIQEYLDDMKGLRIIEDDIEQLKIFLNNSYYANDFYIKDIVTVAMQAFDELAIKAKFESVPAIVNEIWVIMGDSGKKIQKGILWTIEKIKIYYKKTVDFLRELLEGDPIEHLSETFKTLVEEYDGFIKRMHVAFIQYAQNLWDQTYKLIVENWHKMLAALEPTFLKLLHYMETIVWNTSQEFLDFLYIRKNEIIESPYFAKFTNFTHDVDRFYKDITGNNTISSVVKYTKVTWNFLREKCLNSIPFGKELQEVAHEIISELNQLRKLPAISFVEKKYWEFFEKVVWFYNYFDVETRLQQFITLLHKKLTDISQTALEAENRYRTAKTKFIFEPSEGIMHLEQKLPMSWHAFNQTPKFQEIPEVKAICDIQNYFVKSQASFWNFYYDYKPYTDPLDWLPPFKAQALLVGSRYYVTFDRKYYNFQGRCPYLLATDFKDHNFSLVVSYSEDLNSHELLLIVNKTVVEINLSTDVVKIRSSAVSELPIQIGDTFIHRKADIVTIDSASGFMLKCNMKFDVCTFEVSGWYFGKTAGLFGTINNEPFDDLTTSKNQRVGLNELKTFTDSWSLDPTCDTSKDKIVTGYNQTSKEVQELCNDIYSNKVSQLNSCFPRVPKEPFLNMCLQSRTIEEACSSAVAYTSVCAYENTPLRIPDICITCTMPNGTSLYEGAFVRLEGSNVPRSADVVFLVEAKDCNQDLKNNKNMQLLTELLQKELESRNITNNRYSVVIFGGTGVYDQPRIKSVNDKMFTDYKSIVKYFDNIPTGNGSLDIFEGLIFATKLPFRPGISKNFVLLPCSECHEDNMKYDYTTLHQLLSENDITLHILMNEEFKIQKTRENKIPFGIDNKRAYTKKDASSLKGDAALRKHIRLPKATFGLCMPLALETNGTLFNVENLNSNKGDLVKKFTSVFAKRVAISAGPEKCVDCECTAPNSGVSYMECYPCYYPSRATIDLGFDEEEILSRLQPSEYI